MFDDIFENMSEEKKLRRIYIKLMLGMELMENEKEYWYLYNKKLVEGKKYEA